MPESCQHTIEKTICRLGTLDTHQQVFCDRLSRDRDNGAALKRWLDIIKHEQAFTAREQIMLLLGVRKRLGELAPGTQH